MLNWVAILRRILGLYNVRTQQDLGMALGVPLDADSLSGREIPWPILERVVAEKGVTWDWLLTGRGESRDPCKLDDAAKARPDNTTSRATPKAPPRIETREFARVLLDGATPEQPGQYEMSDSAGGENSEAMLEAELLPHDEPGDEAGLLDRLKEIKDSMQKEIDRVDRILRERGEE